MLIEKNAEVKRALSVAKAKQWEGDHMVNFMTAHRSCVVLARYIEKLEFQIEELETKSKRQGNRLLELTNKQFGGS